MKSETHNMDCMAYMATLPDKAFSLAVVDPPYGLNIAKEKPRASGRWNYAPKQWDALPPDADYFRELHRVSKHQIIWGGNYFELPPARCWLIWDKQQSVPNFAAAELAWTSFDEVVAAFRYSFSANINKIHVCQKPVALYAWILQNYAKPGDVIFDSHMGSQSSRIAAWDLGFDYTGCELDPDYFRDGEERFERHKQQEKLFTPEHFQPQEMALAL